jgi:hypothetical protein
MPAFLEISTMGYCINKCFYCPYELYKNSYTSDIKTLSFDNFKTMIDELPINSTISWAGYNEPFKNQECVDMILYANSKGFLQWCFSSLVGMSISQYQRIKHIQFGYFSVHLPDNKGKTQIPITQKYLDTLKYIVNNPPSGYFILHHHDGDLHDSIKDIVTASSLLIPHDRAGNVSNNDERMIVRNNNQGKLKCGHTFLFNFNEGAGVLLPDGTVTLCCSDFGLTHKLGNLLTQSWEEIMQGTEMQRICKGLADESEDILCRTCAIARGVL